MKNPNIARQLKYYRKLNQLSVNEVSDLLKTYANPAAPKTIYGWESGQTQPDADTFMLLCELYNIEHVLDAFGYKKNPIEVDFIFTDEEKKLVIEYRKHTEMQPAIHKLLELNHNMSIKL